MAGKRISTRSLGEDLERKLGYAFADASLLETALTHSSVPGVNNERLEFLGDRILGLIVADMLWRAYPQAPQGELAVRLNALVSGATCAEIALELGLQDFIRASPSPKSQKGSKARNVMADAVEALIAALYVDGSLEAARRFVLRYWEPRAKAAVQAPRDPKTALQEWVVRIDGARPVYTIENREGPEHEPVFTVSVAAPNFAPALASGRSRQAAERAAAAAFLVREGIWEANPS